MRYGYGPTEGLIDGDFVFSHRLNITLLWRRLPSGKHTKKTKENHNFSCENSL